MTLRTTPHRTTKEMTAHTKNGLCVRRGKARQHARSPTMTGNAKLNRSASAKRPESAACNARAVPQPGHFSPVNAKKGHRGNILVSDGSNSKRTSIPRARKRTAPASADMRRRAGADEHLDSAALSAGDGGTGLSSLPFVIRRVCSVPTEEGSRQPNLVQTT